MGNKNSISSVNESHQLQQIDENSIRNRSDSNWDPEIRYMRRSLKKDQDVFILNNLMLSIQFFENYEREIFEIRSSPISQRENDANKILSQSQKRILIPGALEERMSRHVKFSSTKLSNFESMIEPLQPIRMHIVLDNINVNNSNDNSITMNDRILYNTRLEPSCNLGYVRLRSTGVTDSRKEQILESQESDLPFIVEDDDEIYCKEEKDIRDSLSGIEKRADKINLSMSELNDSVDSINRGTSLPRIGRIYSDDEGFTESLSCGGTPERRLSGPLRQSRNSKSRSQLHSRSLESIPRSSRSSGYKSGSFEVNSVIETESDYSYGTTASSNMSESSFGRENLPVLSSEIPASCFKTFISTLDGKVMSGEKANRKNEPRSSRRIRKIEECQTEERSYLRNRKFRRYFEDLFINQLAKPLGFEIEDDNDVTRQGAMINCYSIKVVEGCPTLVTPHEILPTIFAGSAASWSDLGERSRGAIIDSPRNRTWMTKQMVDEIERLGCHAIPESYRPSRETDPYHAVEWQLTFPAVERYLENSLSHSQARIYLAALMLQKNFIQSTDPVFGLSKSHIRSQLFWLLEENDSPLTWSENREGEGLMRLLRKLHFGVSQSQPYIADYLMSGKNLFANIPRQYLHLTQKQIRRIIDNPVMYVINALRNVRYEKEFFPVMDYSRLFKLLTVRERDLVPLIRPELDRVDRVVSQVPEENEQRIPGLRNRGNKRKENSPFESLRESSYQRNNVNKESKDNSGQDLVIQITDECAELNGLRLTSVFSMFIEHFIEMAKCCYRYGAIRQKDVYLNQARRLALILRDEAFGKDDAERYLGRVNTLRNELSSFEARDEPGTSRGNEISGIGVPLNQFFTDNPERQELTSLVQKIHVDIHSSPA